jgi:hypothetical protein
VEEDENCALMEEIKEDKLKEVLQSFQKDKSPGPDIWTLAFFLVLYKVIGKDLLKVVEEPHINGVIHPPFNATFLALILKKDDPQSFEDFRPISLYNCIYKITAKIISRRIKPIISKSISPEQLCFLKRRHIHDAVGVAQESLHNMFTTKSKGAAIKINLSKDFDRVSWLYIRLLLTHLGFNLPFINWVISYITTTSFVVLINGGTSPFFQEGRGLRQGCPLSPLLFLLVA